MAEQVSKNDVKPESTGLPTPTAPTPAPAPAPTSDLKTSARVITNEAQSAAGKQGQNIKSMVVGSAQSVVGAVGQCVEKAQGYLQQCQSTDSTATSTAPASDPTPAPTPAPESEDAKK